MNLGPTQGTPGATVSIPVNLVLNAGVSLDSIAFGVSLTPNLDAPTIANPLTFQADASGPSPSLIHSEGNPTSIAVAYLNLPNPLSGTVHLGDIMAVIPASASADQDYAAAFKASTLSATLGTGSVLVFAGQPVAILVGYTYLVGDAYPNTSDIGGSFGDGQLNTLDLIATLRAVTELPGFLPASCSDRFDAMDSYPLDTNIKRGGDGMLNTLDLVETLKRITNIDTTRPIRVQRGLPCLSPAIPDAVRRGPATGFMWFGDVQPAAESVVRAPVYLRVESGLDLAGLSFAVGLQGQGNSLQFVPAGVGAPSLIDTGVPGALAVAWLDTLQIPRGDTLIGYVQVSGVDPAANFSLVFYGVDANRRSDGRSVQFATPRRR